MPEETLRYRVEIDQSDLATQLASVKQQLDQAMGSMSFSEMGKNLPTDPLTAGIASFAESAMSTANNFQQEVVGGRDFFMQSMESGRLGFQKFRDDMYQQGLVSPPRYAHQSDYQLQQMSRGVEPLKDYGTIKSFFGEKMGMGYDKEMPISRGQYKRAMGQKWDEGKEDLADWGIFGASLLAAPATGGASLVAEGVYSVAKMTKLLDTDTEPMQEFAKFIQQSTYRNMGHKMTDAESLDASKSIRNMAYDGKVRTEVGGKSDVEDVIAEFSAQGGFLDTSTVEQYKQRAKETVENFRKVQYAIQGSTEDALKAMSDVIQGGMATGSAEASALINKAAQVGQATGTGTSEMLQLAQQGAEMVRGSGISMEKGASDMINMYSNVRQNFDSSIVQEAGGSVQAATSLQTMAYNYSNSPSGQLALAAQVGGLAMGTGSMSDVFGAAGRAMGGTPEDALDLAIKMDRVREATSPDSQLLTMGNQHLNIMKNLGIDNVSKDQFGKFMMDMGQSRTDSELLAEVVFQDPKEKIAMAMAEVLYNEQKKLDEAPSDKERLKAENSAARDKWYTDNIAKPVGDAWEAAGGVVDDVNNWLFGRDVEDENRNMWLGLRSELFLAEDQVTYKDVKDSDIISVGGKRRADEWEKTAKNKKGNYKYYIATSREEAAKRGGDLGHYSVIGEQGSAARDVAMSGTDSANDLNTNYLFQSFNNMMYKWYEAGIDVPANATHGDLLDIQNKYKKSRSSSKRAAVSDDLSVYNVRAQTKEMGRAMDEALSIVWTGGVNPQTGKRLQSASSQIGDIKDEKGPDGESLTDADLEKYAETIKDYELIGKGDENLMSGLNTGKGIYKIFNDDMRNGTSNFAKAEENILRILDSSDISEKNKTIATYQYTRIKEFKMLPAVKEAMAVKERASDKEAKRSILVANSFMKAIYAEKGQVFDALGYNMQGWEATVLLSDGLDMESVKGNLSVLKDLRAEEIERADIAGKIDPDDITSTGKVIDNNTAVMDQVLTYLKKLNE